VLALQCMRDGLPSGRGRHRAAGSACIPFLQRNSFTKILNL
jgi:hypothetical protein